MTGTVSELLCSRPRSFDFHGRVFGTSLNGATHHQAHWQCGKEGHEQSANYRETNPFKHCARDVSTPICAGLWCKRA
jgi:hypothetical protein